MPNYEYGNEVLNKTKNYEFLLDLRDLKQIKHFKTKTFSKQLRKINISVTRHTWKNGDKLYKLAYKYYNNYDFWWVISLINKKFCDGDFKFGDVILIPNDPNFILTIIESST